MAERVVLSIISNNKFSSVHIISSLSGIPEKNVQECINTLLHKGVIYQSVGGYPKRYSHSDEKHNRYYINEDM